MISTSRMFEMLAYSFESTLICCLLVFAYCTNKHLTKKIQPEDIMLAVILVCLAGFRYEVGSDYSRYLSSFNFSLWRFSDLNVLFSRQILSRYSYEVGFQLLSVITGWFSKNTYAIFWVVALILYIPTVIFIRKKTTDAHAAFATFILFGFWGLSLNVLKQAIAMLFTVCAYETLKKKKYFFTGLFTIIAVLFHTTSIAAIALLVISRLIGKKVYIPTKKNLRFLVIIGIALRFGTSLILILMSRFSVFTKYVNYLNGQSTGIERSFIWIGALIETVYICIMLLIALNKVPQLKERNQDIEEVISIIMIGIPFSIIGISRNLWLSNRFAKFFFIFIIVLVPSLFGRGKTDTYRGRYIIRQKGRILFWLSMIIWHMLYSVLMLDNNFFKISTYLFN